MKLDTALANGLRAGMSVDTDFLSHLQLESEKMTALDKALRHISVSMKTEKEIRTFLKKKGYLEEVENYVIDKMKATVTSTTKRMPPRMRQALPSAREAD